MVPHGEGHIKLARPQTILFHCFSCPFEPPVVSLFAVSKSRIFGTNPIMQLLRHTWAAFLLALCLVAVALVRFNQAFLISAN
jgi:hypothetical protein